MAEKKLIPRFYECSGCCFLHPLGWDGDCRDDEHRFAEWQVFEKYGEAWELVDEEEEP